MTFMDAELVSVLDYTNEDVLDRFTKSFAIEEEEAVDIFNETKKFLCICNLPGVFIPDDLLIIDEMWHNFILFTKEYNRFCLQYFGHFLHHLPASKKEKGEAYRFQQEDQEKAKKQFRQKMEVLMGIVYDTYGEETLLKWFSIYPQKYTKEQIKKLRNW